MVQWAKTTWSPRPHCFDLHSTDKNQSLCPTFRDGCIREANLSETHVFYVTFTEVYITCLVTLKLRYKPMGTGDEKFEMLIQGPGDSSVVEVLATQV